MPKTAKALADEIEQIWNAAEAEGRELTPREREHMKGLVDAAESQHAIEQQIKAIDPGAPLLWRMNGTGGSGGPVLRGGPGDVFVASKAYQQIRADRGQKWTYGQTLCRSRRLAGSNAGTSTRPEIGPGSGPPTPRRRST